MYKVVYVLVDNENLKFTNELMISLMSLRNKMPQIKISVITDKNTYKILENKKHPIFKYSDIKGIEISNEYSQKEKSRFLKTSLRRYIKGDFLFVDTDTVVCSKFPEAISDADIAMVLDYNCLISNRLDREGVKALNVTEKNGNLAAVKNVNDDEELMIITNSGIIIKIPMNQVSKMSRVTQGVRLINLKENQKVTTIATTKAENEEENTEETVE